MINQSEAIAKIEANGRIYAAAGPFREAVLDEMLRVDFIHGSRSHRLHIGAAGPALPFIVLINGGRSDGPMMLFGAEVVVESGFSEGQWELRPVNDTE